ncbi:MAG: hypothetical protein JNL34_04130 [Anaerolineae bacterium]|nr:hypothetical protein [Anaerolineae bacterium]
MNVQITVDLPEALVAEARAAGILNNERIAAILERELRREESWEQFSTSAAGVREAAADDLARLSDDDIMRLVEAEIDQMRSEAAPRGAVSSNPEL